MEMSDSLYSLKHIINVPKSLVYRSTYEENVLPDYRNDFMRDRDRVLYSTAFRRLAGKTQIYTVGNDDHRRNRLSHTLEVSQIARTIAVALGLNSDLAEAIALAHDLGHTPFGHAGEQMLHEIMIPGNDIIDGSPFCDDRKEIEKIYDREAHNYKNVIKYLFGFKHNLQSVRVCARLEDCYRGHNYENIGLNLTNFTLYGMMIHTSIKHRDSDFIPDYQVEFEKQMQLRNCGVVLGKEAWSLEAYIVSLADHIAQWHHDLEDAIRGHAMPKDAICQTIEEAIGNDLSEFDRIVLNNEKNESGIERNNIALLSHIVVNTLVNNVVNTSKRNIESLGILEKGIDNPESFFSEYEEKGFLIEKNNIISFSNSISTDKFEKVIKESVHHSYDVERMNGKGKYIIRKLFEAYYTNPQQLPDGPIIHIMVGCDNEKYPSIEAAKKEGIGKVRTDFEKMRHNMNIYQKSIVLRRICDHIASMTDSYAINEFNNLYE